MGYAKLYIYGWWNCSNNNNQWKRLEKFYTREGLNWHNSHKIIILWKEANSYFVSQQTPIYTSKIINWSIIWQLTAENRLAFTKMERCCSCKHFSARNAGEAFKMRNKGVKKKVRSYTESLWLVIRSHDNNNFSSSIPQIKGPVKNLSNREQIRR